MSSLHEQIELLQAELRNCTDRAERTQIRAELGAGIASVRREAERERAAASLVQAPAS
jgi:hypothetical protein